MTNITKPPSHNSAPLHWPAEWAKEELFWRDVATRTIAGVLTILILAFPGLIYAGIFGLLTPAQVAPILIGIALIAVLITGYLVVLWWIRRKTRIAIEDALEAEELDSETHIVMAALLASSPEERDRILSDYTETTASRIREADTLGKRLRSVASLTTLLATLIIGLAPLIANFMR